MNIKDIFVTNNASLDVTMKVIDASGLGMAIIYDDKFDGIITDSDIRHALLNGTRLDTKIREIKNKEPIILHEGYKQADISNLLTSENLGKFPIYGSLPIPIISKKGEPIDVIFVSKQGKVIKHTPSNNIVKKILIVGGAGYLGSMLSKLLLKKGYYVRVLDNLTYGDIGIKHVFSSERFEFMYGDIRNIKDIVKAVKGVDAVIHLAAIVGDPASALNPEETIESNYLATKTLADVCKYAQINRFIFASTASVYGASDGKTELTEKSKLNPVSLYADMKLKSEQAIMEITEGNFKPTIFRMGTLFGESQRMRFDLVVNILSIKGIYEGTYNVFGGEQYRAFCHVQDAAESYIRCLELPLDKVGNQTFNIVSQNSTIFDVSKTITEYIDAKPIIDENNTDNRNYAVSNKKFVNTFKWTPNKLIDYGIREIKVHSHKYADYKDKKYSNYAFLKGEE